jgi:hypothetical protein
MRWDAYVAGIGEMRNVSRILVRKPEGKRLLARRTHRWEDNIRTDLMKRKWEGVDWTHVGRDGDQWRAPRYTANEPSTGNFSTS